MQLYSETLGKDPHTLLKVRALYKRAFPRRERMPLRLLRRSAGAPCVEWQAWFCREAFVGFTYLVKDEQIAYLFYFAVEEAVRSRGIGGAILDAILQQHEGKTLVLDVETCAEEAKNLTQRKKRLQFYLRHGFAPAGFWWQHRGVHYTALCRGGSVGEERMKQFFQKYRHEALGKRR